MRWSRVEIERLYPVLEQVSSDMSPVDGKDILILGSSSGEVVFWLAEMMETGRVTGLELDEEARQVAQRTAHEMGLGQVVTFGAGEVGHIPLPEASLDGLVSESILYPTLQPANITHAEMLRVLKPGGRMGLTDIIVTSPPPPDVREALASIGLDTLHEATQNDVTNSMLKAGFVNVKLTDFTYTFRAAWEARRGMDRSTAHWLGYSALLEPGDFCLGRAIFYIYVRADKPKMTDIG